MNKILIGLSLILLQGCTVLAVADAAGSAVIYAGKTVINTVDAITPDVVNKKKWPYRGLVENIHVLIREGAYRFVPVSGTKKTDLLYLLMHTIWVASNAFLNSLRLASDQPQAP